MKFCRQCMEKFFGENLADETNLKSDGEVVQCDGCGVIETDSDGNCLTHADHDTIDRLLEKFVSADN